MTTTVVALTTSMHKVTRPHVYVASIVGLYDDTRDQPPIRDTGPATRDARVRTHPVCPARLWSLNIVGLDSCDFAHFGLIRGEFVSLLTSTS